MSRWTANAAIGLILLGGPCSALAEPGEDQYAVAAGHYARGRWQLAAEEFEAFLDEHREHPRADQAVFFLAEALVQLGRYGEAAERFGDYLERQPEGRYARPASFRLGETAYLSGDFASATDALVQFRQQYPDDALNEFVLTYLGDLSLATKDYRSAANYYETALERFGDGRLQADCRYGLGRALEELGERDRARALFEALAGEKASAWADDAQFRLGSCLYDAGDYAEAEAAFAQLMVEWPESRLVDKATLGRGWALYHLKRYDEAGGCFASVVEGQSLAGEAQYWLGLVQLAQQQYGQAIATLSELADADPPHALSVAARFQCGEARRRGGDLREALRDYEQVLVAEDRALSEQALLATMQASLALGDFAALDAAAAQLDAGWPESPLRRDALRLHVRGMLERKDYAAAVERLAPLLNGDEAEGAERYLLALAYLGQQRYVEAEAVVTPVLASGDEALSADAQLAWGGALVGQGRYEEAIEPLARYLTVKPDGEGAARCRAQLAICEARTGDFESARQWYREFRERHADDPLFHPTTLHVAEAAYAAGERSWAGELFAVVERAGGDDQQLGAKALSGLGWSLFEQGRLDEAAAQFERLLSLHPNHASAAEAALARAQILERLERLDPALAAYQHLLERYAESEQRPQALWNAARLHDRLRQQNDALRCYSALAEEFPDWPERDAVLYEWAWCLREDNREEEAAAVFAELRERYPASRYWGDATYRLAEAAYRTKDFEEAERLSAELTADDDSPVLEHGLYLAGQVAAAQGKWQESQHAMERLAGRFPGGRLHHLAQYWSAEALYRLERFEEAGERFDALADEEIEAESWAPMVCLRRAQVLAQRRAWREALAAADAIGPTFPAFEQQYEVDYLRGRCFAALALFEEAREAYRKVTRSERGGATETAAMAQWMIGESYFHQKDYRAALREYLRGEVLYGYRTWQAASLLQAAKCHERLGESNEASQLYRRVSEEYGETTFAEEARQRLRVARQGNRSASG